MVGIFLFTFILGFLAFVFYMGELEEGRGRRKAGKEERETEGDKTRKEGGEGRREVRKERKKGTAKLVSGNTSHFKQCLLL